MKSEGLDRLTEKQRECLRLVYAHMSSKEIAKKLGVEPGTVDQYVKAAMRILGTPDRRSAARMLAGQENADALPALAMREEQDAYTAEGHREPVLPLPWKELRPTHVGWKKRLGWIAGISIAIAIGFAALIAAAEGFSRLMRF